MSDVVDTSFAICDNTGGYSSFKAWRSIMRSGCIAQVLGLKELYICEVQLLFQQVANQIASSGAATIPHHPLPADVHMVALSVAKVARMSNPFGDCKCTVSSSIYCLYWQADWIYLRLNTRDSNTGLLIGYL
jgi:hypothetical protein